MTPRFRPTSALFLFVCFAAAASAVAQEVASVEAADEPSDRFRAEASKYEFSYRDSDKPLTQQPQPLLHWSNPARRGEDGMVFLWTDGNRPCVIGTCFTYPSEDGLRGKHEFRVLTNDGIRGRHEGRVMWNPPEDTVAYHPLMNAPSPAPTPSQRQVQLRIFARQFNVEMTSADGRKEQCRLVPQPLYRYDGDDPSEPAGAIFSFAIGTDPEALLILDRRADDSGNPGWYYAMVRLTYNPLEGFLNEQSVWKVEKAENLSGGIFSRPDYQREPYILFRSH